MLANHHAPASNGSPEGDSDRSGLDPTDYDIILSALLESARGRSFLEEHARRNRATETATLLAAIGRIEDLLTSRSLETAGPPAITDVERFEAGLPAIEPATMPRPAETLDVDVFEAEAPQNENSAPHTGQHEVIVSAEARDIEIISLEVTPEPASAIEFLGPQSLSVAERDEPQPPAGPTETAQRPRDPFADIRALSDEEKIALFA
jgi:hypothetical protein